MASLFDQALASIGAAVSDVREKVVEEGYFGRAVSNGPDSPEPLAASSQSSDFEQALGSRIQQFDISPNRSQDTPEAGGGMDR